jgi:hypothetical protein
MSEALVVKLLSMSVAYLKDPALAGLRFRDRDCWSLDVEALKEMVSYSTRE